MLSGTEISIVRATVNVVAKRISDYATFEVESGDRMELSVDGEAFGLLAEGDAGELCFQGRRFLSFERR